MSRLSSVAEVAREAEGPADGFLADSDKAATARPHWISRLSVAVLRQPAYE